MVFYQLTKSSASPKQRIPAQNQMQVGRTQFIISLGTILGETATGNCCFSNLIFSVILNEQQSLNNPLFQAFAEGLVSLYAKRCQPF